MTEKSDNAIISSSIAGEEMFRINFRCNQRCVFCNVFGVYNRDMESDDFCRRIASIPKETMLVFSGGEPTIDRSLFRYLSLAEKLGFQKIMLQTNAMMCSNYTFAERLKDKGVSFAFVGLHAPDEKLSDVLTRTPGSFRLTMQGIANIIEAGIELSVNFVTNSRNYKRLPEFICFIEREFGPSVFAADGRKNPFFSFSFVQPNGRALQHSGIVPRISDAAPYIIDAFSLCGEYRISFVNSGCGIPICFTPGYHMYSSEYLDLRVRGAGSTGLGENLREKVKGPQCARCRFFDFCPGVWKNYKKLYGVGELIPV